MTKQRTLPDEPLTIPIIDKQHTPTYIKMPTSWTTTPKTLKSRTQINPITSPTKRTPHKEINDYWSVFEITISVPIVAPSKYSTFLIQK